MKRRMLAVLLALPLVAFDCGEEKNEVQCPLGCRVSVRGTVAEDFCCVPEAIDFSVIDPQSTEWAFMLTAFRTTAIDEAVSVGIFFDGRPALGAGYGWMEGDSSTAISWGSAHRFQGSAVPPYSIAPTHSADSASGTGALSVQFSVIPPGSAFDEEVLGVHGTLTATLPADEAGPTPLAPAVTISASF